MADVCACVCMYPESPRCAKCASRHTAVVQACKLVRLSSANHDCKYSQTSRLSFHQLSQHAGLSRKPAQAVAMHGPNLCAFQNVKYSLVSALFAHQAITAKALHQPGLPSLGLLPAKLKACIGLSRMQAGSLASFTYLSSWVST